jgi:hypothetical protein
MKWQEKHKELIYGGAACKAIEQKDAVIRDLEALRSVSASQETMSSDDNIGSGQIDWVVIKTTMTAVWNTRLAPSSMRFLGQTTVSGKIEWMTSKEIFDQWVGKHGELLSRRSVQDVKLKQTSCWF